MFFLRILKSWRKKKSRKNAKPLQSSRQRKKKLQDSRWRICRFKPKESSRRTYLKLITINTRTIKFLTTRTINTVKSWSPRSIQPMLWCRRPRNRILFIPLNPNTPTVKTTPSTPNKLPSNQPNTKPRRPPPSPRPKLTWICSNAISLSFKCRWPSSTELSFMRDLILLANV